MRRSTHLSDFLSAFYRKITETLRVMNLKRARIQVHNYDYAAGIFICWEEPLPTLLPYPLDPFPGISVPRLQEFWIEFGTKVYRIFCST
jgi:hypothetical protein